MEKQILTSFDPLKDFKENAFIRYGNCSFFEHDVNGTVDIGSGFYKDRLVRQKIITDGKISIQKRNPYRPGLICKQVFVSLKNGVSIKIKINKASFMILVNYFGDKKDYEIHIEKEEQASLQAILNYLYSEQPIKSLSSITFKSPSFLVLQSATNGISKTETFDFIPKHEKTLVKRKNK